MADDVAARMRDDWNARAVEDANYYVAFGRRDQSEDEFFETAKGVVRGIQGELRHLGSGNRRARRALEIGCGPGRLMRPLSEHFGEIHGVDVSDEMVRLARERLRGVAHAHVHAGNGAELPQFADESFDLVYSYAVFQHIPSRDVVLSYLRETHRVLKPGGLVRMQFNGLPQSARQYDTWFGVRISAEDLIAFAMEYDFQVLAMEGISTQYMWTTWRKREPGWRSAEVSSRAEIHRITNAQNSEPVAPNRGLFACVSVWMRYLPADVDLVDLEITAGNRKARAMYAGPPDESGVRQLNAVLTECDDTGLMPLELLWRGKPLCAPAVLRMIPAGPAVPRLLSVTDGVNLLAGNRIETRFIKATFEEVEHADRFAAALDGDALPDVDVFCTDPQSRRYEVNIRLPEGTAAGPHALELRLGRRRFAPVGIDVVTPQPSA